jgi:cytochrome c-type biogenesis protein CcmE
MYETLFKGDAMTYFHNADEVLVNQTDFTGRKIRLGGYVEECSILQKKGTMEYLFEVRPDHPHNLTSAANLKYPQAKGKTITVSFTGIAPDTFKDNAEVIVSGVLKGDVFEGTELVAKCPSKYEAAEQNMAEKRPAKKNCDEVRAQKTTLTSVGG